jgi:hypothetical protein
MYGARRLWAWASSTVRSVWTPTADEGLASELQAALARPHASYVQPPRPVALVGEQKVTGWLWGRMRTADGAWLGLATLWRGSFFAGAELDWFPAQDLRVLH